MAVNSPLSPSGFRGLSRDTTVIPSGLSEFPAPNQLQVTTPIYKLPSLKLDFDMDFEAHPPTPESPTLLLQKRRARCLHRTDNYVSLQTAIEAVFQFDGRTDRYKPWYWYDSLRLRIPIQTIN